MSHYWTQAVQSRISRRRALAATGAGALGAAFLAACGGSDKDGPNQAPAESKSGLISNPVDTTDKGKAGGTIKTYGPLDPLQGLDPLASNHRVTLNATAFTYQRLLQNLPVKYPKPVTQSVQGDVAESYEISPDKLTITFKIRQGIKWDSRPPTNGRLLDAQDVMFSWNKFMKSHPSRSELAYDAQTAKTAPIESMTSPDARTIVLKLKAPDASLLPMLANDSYLYIMPRESESGFNPKSDMRGSGPWILEEYVPSSRLVWRRNPDYFVKDRPWPDRVEQPIVSEYAQRLAQFRSGNIYSSVVTQEDVVQTKKDLADTVLMQASTFPAGGGLWQFTFGYEGDSPWKDQRMRQALSMSVDREAVTDVIYNRDKFRTQGLEMVAARNTSIVPGYTGYWIDPSNEKEFGPNGKYLNYNLAEAKKLMAAAGNPSAPVQLYFTPQQPPPGPRIVEVYGGMFTEAGFKVTNVPLSMNEWYSSYYSGYATKDPATGKAKGYNGLNEIVERAGPTVPAAMYGQYHKDSGFYKGISPDGRNVEQGDPKLNELIEKMRTEFDVPKQQAMAQDAQRLIAGQTYHIPLAASVKLFSVLWPAISNLGAYSVFGFTEPGGAAGSGAVWNEGHLNWWIDSTKAPLTKS